MAALQQTHTGNPFAHAPGLSAAQRAELDQLYDEGKLQQEPEIDTAPGVSQAKTAYDATIGGAKDVVDFIENPEVWVRVGEVVVGILLLFIGIDAMTKAGLGGKAVKAGKAALA